MNAIRLPHACITPSALRSLATALDRFRAMHDKLGGAGDDEPCLTELAVDPAGRVAARVRSGHRTFILALSSVTREWEFL